MCVHVREWYHHIFTPAPQCRSILPARLSGVRWANRFEFERIAGGSQGPPYTKSLFCLSSAGHHWHVRVSRDPTVEPPRPCHLLNPLSRLTNVDLDALGKSTSILVTRCRLAPAAGSLESGGIERGKLSRTLRSCSTVIIELPLEAFWTCEPVS